MKNILITIISMALISLSYTHICKAQSPFQISSIDTDVLKRTFSMLYVIKMPDSTVLTTHDMIIDMKRIEKIEKISTEGLQQNHGDVKPNSQMVLIPKPGVKFVNFTKLLNKFHVKKKYRNYPVIVDRSETEDPKTLLADLEVIDKVVVNKEKKYIEIITMLYDSNMAYRKQSEEGAEKDRINRELWKKDPSHLWTPSQIK